MKMFTAIIAAALVISVSGMDLPEFRVIQSLTKQVNQVNTAMTSYIAEVDKAIKELNKNDPIMQQEKVDIAKRIKDKDAAYAEKLKLEEEQIKNLTDALAKAVARNKKRIPRIDLHDT